MDEMHPFERQVAAEVAREMRTSRPVDAVAVIAAAEATRSSLWRFHSTYSATKFVVAAVVVALFGGFLMAGVLTQPSEEMAPGAATPSQSTEIRSDLVPGLDLDVETIGPRVTRILGDGERQLRVDVKDVVVAPNSDVWIMRPNGAVHRLGERGSAFQQREAEFDLRDDGTIWVGNLRLEGELWVKDPQAFCSRSDEQLAPNGTCWRAHFFGGLTRYDDSDRKSEAGRPGNPLFGHYGVDIGPDGTVWTVVDGDSPNFGLASYDGATWTDVMFDEIEGFGRAKRVTVAPDGVVWAMRVGEPTLEVISWDGEAWATYGEMETLDGWGRPGIDFLPDGSPWFGGIAELDGDTLRPIEVLTPAGDGTHVVWALANDPDGSTWLVVGPPTDHEPGDGRGGLFVITPDLATGTE